MSEAKREQRPACTVMRADAPYTGKQGFSYAPAISAETVG